MARKVQIHLETMLEELQFLEEEKIADTDFDELLVPLKHILTILSQDEE